MIKLFNTAQREEVARQLMVADRQAVTDMRAARRNAAQGSLDASYCTVCEAAVEVRHNPKP
jgi:hypothetical protein